MTLRTSHVDLSDLYNDTNGVRETSWPTQSQPSHWTQSPDNICIDTLSSLSSVSSPLSLQINKNRQKFSMSPNYSNSLLKQTSSQQTGLSII